METLRLPERVARAEVSLAGVLLPLVELVAFRFFTAVHLLVRLRLDKREHLFQLTLHTGAMAEEVEVHPRQPLQCQEVMVAPMVQEEEEEGHLKDLTLAQVGLVHRVSLLLQPTSNL